MKKRTVLTTGEFATLCKTTKETLFHYDRENLLKPRFVSENGYRRYGVEQFFDFDIIVMLKETGSSLKEIKTYMEQAHGGDFLRLLEEKLRIVRAEKNKLAQREAMLRDMTAETREALTCEYDTFTVLEQDEERLEVLPTVASLDNSMVDIVSRSSEYIEFYNRQNRSPRRPFGALLAKEDLEQGRYLERGYFSRATRSTPRAMLHIKPKGRYAVTTHKGSLQAHYEVFQNLLAAIPSSGLRVAGNGYLYDMMSCILPGAGKNYAVRYCVQVE